jgi:hypothetical protein
MQDLYLYIVSYLTGSVTVFLLLKYQIHEKQNELLDHLIENGFLKHRVDNAGNVIILKYRNTFDRQ